MKKIFKIVIIIALTFVTIHVEKDFKNRDVFKVSKVQINEISESLSKDLEKIKKEILKENINNINIDVLNEKLLKDARVKKVEISKKNLNEIEILIEERTSKFYGQYKNKLYMVDKDGVVFGRTDEFERKSMPILVLDKESSRKDLISILNKIEDLDFLENVSQIEKINNNLIVIILTDGTKIKTQTDISKNRYKVIISLYKELNKKIEYIDARFKDILIKEKEGKDAR
nr:cell division protein FtsQ/DivIB [uncultured Cetobacterium sp.]